MVEKLVIRIANLQSQVNIPRFAHILNLLEEEKVKYLTVHYFFVVAAYTTVNKYTGDRKKEKRKNYSVSLKEILFFFFLAANDLWTHFQKPFYFHPKLVRCAANTNVVLLLILV